MLSNKFAAVKYSHHGFYEEENTVKEITKKLLSIKGKRTTDDIHRQLGRIMWNNVGMARNEAGLKEAIIRNSAAYGKSSGRMLMSRVLLIT